MSDVFVDTSGFLALLVESDGSHRKARRAFARLATEEARLVTTSYVLVETYALLRSRVGKVAVRRFRDEFEPLLDVVWVGAGEHRKGLDQLETLSRSVSLVDAVSFAVAAAHGIEQVFAFDRHFVKAGFALRD